METGGFSGEANKCLHGYKCVVKEETVPSDFQCTSCDKILREPSLTSCCSQNFCTEFLKGKQLCPGCNKELHSGFSKYLHKQIQKLSVFCAEKSHGCNWEGEIRDFDEHISLCEYVQVTCDKCEQEVSKGLLEAHQREECPKREYSCPHCNFKDTYSFVTKAHLPICSDAPVVCPNRCGVAGERDDMEDHLEEACPLQYIECLFRPAGCTRKFRRDDTENHMKENISSHLVSMASLTFQMNTKIEELASKTLKEDKKEDEKKENGQEDNVVSVTKVNDGRKESKVREIEEEISDLRKTMNVLLERTNSLAESITNEVSPLETLTENDKMEKDLEKKLQEKEAKIQFLTKSLENQKSRQMRLEKRIAKVEETLSEKQLQETATIPRTTVTFEGFTDIKGKKEHWTSTIFNTSPQNKYKLKLTVWPSGQGEGKGTHVSVWLEQDVGETENPPAHVFVSFELLNQLSDGGHVHAHCNFPVTNDRYLGAISNNQLIEHSELEYNASRGTQYLANDSLKFRVRIFIEPIKTY